MKFKLEQNIVLYWYYSENFPDVVAGAILQAEKKKKKDEIRITPRRDNEYASYESQNTFYHDVLHSIPSVYTECKAMKKKKVILHGKYNLF